MAFEVHPALGQASPSGRNIGECMTSTIGHERPNNLKLHVPSEDEFVKQVLASLPVGPRQSRAPYGSAMELGAGTLCEAAATH